MRTTEELIPVSLPADLLNEIVEWSTANTWRDVDSEVGDEVQPETLNEVDAATSNQPVTNPQDLITAQIEALRQRLMALRTNDQLITWCRERGSTSLEGIARFINELNLASLVFLNDPLTTTSVAGFKRLTLHNLNKLSQKLREDHSLWEKYLMPIVNMIIALFVRLERMFFVPSSWQPGLFQCQPTLVETRVQELPLETELNQIFDELEAQVLAATMV